jgi:hypothetical protein
MVAVGLRKPATDHPLAGMRRLRTGSALAPAPNAGLPYVNAMRTTGTAGYSERLNRTPFMIFHDDFRKGSTSQVPKYRRR